MQCRIIILNLITVTYITVPCSKISSLNFSLWWKSKLFLTETLKHVSRLSYVWFFSLCDAVKRNYRIGFERLWNYIYSEKRDYWLGLNSFQPSWKPVVMICKFLWITVENSGVIPLFTWENSVKTNIKTLGMRSL